MAGPCDSTLFLISFSAQDVTVPAQGKAIAPTDIAIAVPEGTYGRVGKCSCECFCCYFFHGLNF